MQNNPLVATSPLRIPAKFTLGDEDNVHQTDDDTSESQRSSPDPGKSSISRHQLKERGTSISFNPNVTLDSGVCQSIESPLPKPFTHNRNHNHNYSHNQSHDQNHKSTPLEIPHKQNRPRRYSDAERGDYDPITGAPLEHHKHPAPKPFHRGEKRHPLLQTTVDDLADETSKLTINTGQIHPIVPNVITSSMKETTYKNAGLSPLSMVSGIQHELSLRRNFSASNSTAPLSMPTRRSVSQRSFGSLGSVGRRHTARSSNSPSSGNLSSPARSFLGGFSMASTPQREPDPDEEGQELQDPATGIVYIIGRQIGYGGSSVVKEATTLLPTGQRVTRAVKIVRKLISGRSEAENEGIQQELEREVDIWRYLRHKYILPLITAHATDYATFCITLLNSSGTLFDLVRAQRKNSSASERGLDGRLARRYAGQIASAIRYLHEDARVVHCDIKPENCLLDMTWSGDDGGRILLCDFGMSSWITAPETRDSDYESANRRHHRPNLDRTESLETPPTATDRIGPGQSSTSTIQGSLEYAAPEMLNPSNNNDSTTTEIRSYNSFFQPPATSVDIWAYGCVLYTLLTCERPFSHEFQPMLIAMIQKGRWDRELLNECPAVKAGATDAVEVIEKCLEMNAMRRLDIRRILGLKWLKGVQEEEEMDEENQSDSGYD